MSKNIEIFHSKITLYEIGSIIKRTNPTVKRPFHSDYELGACMQSAFPEKYETFTVIRYLQADPLIFETDFLEDFCFTFHLDQVEFKSNFEAIKAPSNFVSSQFIPLRHLLLHRELRKIRKNSEL